MARKYKLLFKIQLYSLFDINRLLHSHDKKEKKRTLCFGAVGLAIIGMLLYLSGYISSTFASIGLVQAIPTLVIVIYSLIVLLLTFLKSSGALIGLKDYDMIMSLPVNNTVIVLSKLSMLYITNLLIGIIVLIPTIFIYGMNTSVKISGYFILFSALLLTPIIPMLIALAIGTLIVAVSSRSKHNNTVALVFSIVGLLLLIFASSKLQTMSTTQITDISTIIIHYFNQFYPPASLFSKALLYNDWGSFGMFVFGSIAILFAFVIVLSHFYKRLNTQVFSHHAGKDFRLGELSVSSPFVALYKRELARFFSCTIYVLNSCIVIIVLLVISFMAVFYMPDVIIQQLETIGIMDIFEVVIPLIISVFVCMCCTTSASLSLEGRSRWIMYSAPVKTITVFKAKIFVNLTVILPILWISLILLRITFPLTMVQTILLFVTPTIYALFISAVGMLFNVKYPRFDWTSEYYAIKGGAISVLATIGVGLALSAIPVYFCVLSREYAQQIVIAMTVVIAVLALIAYRMLSKIRLYI